MTINLKGEVLVITFHYNPIVVERIKSVSGRQFNPKLKHWEVPAANVLELLEAVKDCKFHIHLDVVNLAREAEKHEVKVLELKNTPTLYTGSLPLYDFQKIGASFLMTMQGALLADVPGLGKTIQTIAACEGAKRILILCPASLKYGWQDEIKKWTIRTTNVTPSTQGDVWDWTVVVDGDKKERKACWTSRGPKWTIANYELLLHDKEIMPKEWDVIVADEATRISNPRALTTIALKSLVAGKKIALTGTPVSNSPVDLYSIIDWLQPGVMGTYFQFLNQYCIREPRFNRIVGFKNLDKLEKVASRFMLRRTKQEVMKDMPPKTVENVTFTLSYEERELYDNVRYEIIEELKNGLEKNLAIVPVKMLRLKQVTDDARLVEHDHVMSSSKLKTLEELIKPIVASGEKVIIFTQFSEMAKILRDHFNYPDPKRQWPTDTLLIHGEVSSEDRQEIVKRFNTDPKVSLLVMTEAGAYGLNLQAATYVIHYDMPWSVAKLQQREDRAHRIGQDKPVTVYNLIAKDTIDEYVAKVLARKNKIAVNLLGDDDRLEEAGLSAEDIKAILRL